ncbi:hypothetical protein, partial [Alicyclobacillus fodiniaquatilis]
MAIRHYCPRAQDRRCEGSVYSFNVRSSVPGAVLAKLSGYPIIASPQKAMSTAFDRTDLECVPSFVLYQMEN